MSPAFTLTVCAESEQWAGLLNATPLTLHVRFEAVELTHTSSVICPNCDGDPDVVTTAMKFFKTPADGKRSPLSGGVPPFRQVFTLG